MLSLDLSAKLLFLTFHTFFVGYDTYKALVKGDDYLKWTYYWVIYLVCKVYDFWFESITIAITFGYYYYFKFIFFSIVYKNPEISHNIFNFIYEKANSSSSINYTFNEIGHRFMDILKTIKSLNKQYIK